MKLHAVNITVLYEVCKYVSVKTLYLRYQVPTLIVGRCVLSIQDSTEPQGDPSKTVLHTCKAITLMTYSYIVQSVSLATEPGISLIILPLKRILQRNLTHTTDTHYRYTL